MAKQERGSNKHQRALEEESRQHGGPTNLFYVGQINVNMPKNGVGTIGNNNVTEAKETSKDTESDNSWLWSLITSVCGSIKNTFSPR